MNPSIAVIVPNWNGEDFLRECIDSLLAQSLKADIIIVDNGSVDLSREIIESYGDGVIRLYNDTNLGFAGGVNTGIRYALDRPYVSVALFNNDAVADTMWLEHLSSSLQGSTGIVTCNFQSIDKQTIDSTGDQFTTWGLSYPRDRGLKVSETNYDTEVQIFGASGGASLYSCAMLRQVGIFDEDFFAYFEDVDISFRAQLAGWKVILNPKAEAYHHIGATSKRMANTAGTEAIDNTTQQTDQITAFSTYQSLKNWPLVIIRDVPRGIMPTILPRFIIAYLFFVASSVIVHRHYFIWVKALWRVGQLLPKKLRERKQIQNMKTVSDQYILSILTHDLPQNQTKLRKLRSLWWKLAKQPKDRNV